MIAGQGTRVSQGGDLLVHTLEARPLRQNANRAAPRECWSDRPRPCNQRLKALIVLGQATSEPLHDLIAQRAIAPNQSREPGTELKIKRTLFRLCRVRIDGVQASLPQECHCHSPTLLNTRLSLTFGDAVLHQLEEGVEVTALVCEALGESRSQPRGRLDLGRGMPRRLVVELHLEM